MKVVGTVLGVLGLFVFGLLAESYGYGVLGASGLLSVLWRSACKLSNRGPGPIDRDDDGEIGHAIATANPAMMD